MNSKIDKVEMVRDDHRTVRASGKIEWDSDEVSATFVVTIAQVKPQGRIVYAIGRSARTFRPSDDWWQVDAVIVDPDDQFQFDIPVDGWSEAAVKLTAGGPEPYPWQTKNLTIDRASAAVAQ
jgi:hypothetical protein